jgi:uncharacterized protein YbcI
MHEAPVEQRSPLLGVSNAMVRLHKEQFGRGPTTGRAYFAGPDMLVCVLSDALLPAERKLVGMGSQDRVMDARTSFRYATRPDFIAAIEQIVQRKVTAFASGIDPDNNTAYEIFSLEHSPAPAPTLGPPPRSACEELRLRAVGFNLGAGGHARSATTDRASASIGRPARRVRRCPLRRSSRSGPRHGSSGNDRAVFRPGRL